MRSHIRMTKAWLAALAAGALAVLAGCAPNTVNSKGGAPELRVAVTAAKVTVKTMPVLVEVIGNVEAYANVSVRTQVAGEIERAYFKEGEYVKKGQLLFTIDRRPFQAALDQDLANLARDQAQLQNAEAQAERNGRLFEEGVISREQYDTVRTNARALEATVRADRAAVETAKVNLGYCSINSPLDGRTGSYQVYPGNIAKANDTVLLVINQIHPIQVGYAVPEQYLAEVRSYQGRSPLRVEASISGDARRPAAGVLTFIDNAVDTATGTIKMRAEFPNLDDRFWPGQFVSVAMQLTARAHATVVPSQAVQTGQAGKYLYVVNAEMKAELRQVVTGVSVAGETLIEKGVVPGETVVTDGQLLLAPGSLVEIKKGA